jgi:hypothetical protein
MSPRLVAWDRLVRYIPEGGENTICYGDAILADSEIDKIAQLANEGKLKVKVLQGDNALDAKPTGKIDVVKKLLGPLEAAEVPIIRCIGLNYKTHSKWKLLPMTFLLEFANVCAPEQFSRLDGHSLLVQLFSPSQGQPWQIMARTFPSLRWRNYNATTKAS